MTAFERRVFPGGLTTMDLVSGVSGTADDTFTVAAVPPGTPTVGPGFVIFDLGTGTCEAMTWDTRSANTFHVRDRGIGGTTPIGHSPGTQNVLFGFTDIDFDEANYWASQLAQITNEGDLYYGTGANELAVLPITNGRILGSVAGVPAWIVPPTSSTKLAAVSVQYGTGNAPGYGASPTPQAFDAVNMVVTFVAPSSGRVTAKSLIKILAASTLVAFQTVWVTHGTATIQNGNPWYDEIIASSGSSQSFPTADLITGLTPGTTYKWDLAWMASSGSVIVKQAYLEIEAA